MEKLNFWTETFRFNIFIATLFLSLSRNSDAQLFKFRLSCYNLIAALVLTILYHTLHNLGNKYGMLVLQYLQVVSLGMQCLHIVQYLAQLSLHFMLNLPGNVSTVVLRKLWSNSSW